MQSTQCAQTPININHSTSKLKPKSSVVTSLPQSPTVVSIVPHSQPVTPKSVPTTPTGFFTFRWLLSGTKKSSKQRSSSHGKLKKSTEKFVPSLTNSKKISRQSYSFDDVEKFLINGNGRSDIGNKSNLYKSTLEIVRSSGSGVKSVKKLNNFSCKLCLMLKSGAEMHSIWSCGCSFCRDCLSQYCETLIREGKISSLTCPDGSCPQQQYKTNLLSPREVKTLVLKESYETYERFRLNLRVERDPNRTWCPTPNCDTICHVKSSRSKNKPVPVYCPTCDRTFCSTCRRNWHSGVACKNYNEREDLIINEMSYIKRCPKCCILIERDEGCAQMMCRNCKHVFCWFCLSSLEDDFLLRHYDKGPCKNKLGHSRASVIWHRTQVVGIFAGFGLLILLASPMFLLAAPCLLCCKCSSWCKYDDDDHYQEDDSHQISTEFNNPNRDESFNII